jgi:predicted phage terminase large subunit-like protein
MGKWAAVYKQAVLNGKSLDDARLTDKDLLFPRKLTADFLKDARKRMGSYMFANQYQNIIIPDDKRTFRKEWFRYYDQLPRNTFSFAMIDPAIGQEDDNDYTGVVVLNTDSDMRWYVRVARRVRLTPTETVNMIFDLHDKFKCMAIGVEDVAYQKALIYLTSEEMRKRKRTVPLKAVKAGPDATKATRISALQPRFEWGNVFLSPGLHDLEMEALQFPRGAHDDIIDALAHCESFVTYPDKEKPPNVQLPPNHPDYERQYIQKKYKQANEDDG